MTTILLMLIVPMVIFVIVDSFASMKTALIAAVVFLFIEFGFTYYFFGELDAVSYLLLVIVLVLAYLSYYKNTPLFFKLKPAIMSGMVAAVFLGSFLFGDPLMVAFVNKYGPMFEPYLETEDLRMRFQFLREHEQGQRLLKYITLNVGIALILHLPLAIYSAYKMSKWWWLVLAVGGFYGFMTIGAYSARFFI